MNPLTFRRDYLLAGRGTRGVRKEFMVYCLLFIVYCCFFKICCGDKVCTYFIVAIQKS